MLISYKQEIYLVTRSDLLGSDLIWIGSLRGNGIKKGQNSLGVFPKPPLSSWEKTNCGEEWSCIQNGYPTTGAHPLPKMGWVVIWSKRSMLTWTSSGKFLDWPASSVLLCWEDACRPQGLAVTWQQTGCPSTCYLLVFTQPPATAHLYT